jgi:hypothetical protein
MYYKHEPGKLVRILSRPGAEPTAIAVLDALNAVVGSLGNKLTIQAQRIEPAG